MNKIALLLLLILVAGCASRAPARTQRVWDASSIANYSHPIYFFRDEPSGKVIAAVTAADIKNMISVKDQVENVSGPIRAKLLVSESTVPNAYSMQIQGKHMIAVNIGMINLIGQDADAMAALMGHELAHFYLNHEKQRQDREGERIANSTILSFAIGMFGVPIGPADFATIAISKSFSREDEREADRVGMELMTTAGFDPCGAVRLQEKLATASSVSKLPFLSTHPASAERVENMKKLAACD